MFFNWVWFCDCWENVVVILEVFNECKGLLVIWVDCIVVFIDGWDLVVEVCINDWILLVVGCLLVLVVSCLLVVVLIVSWLVLEDIFFVFVLLRGVVEVMFVYCVRLVCGDEVFFLFIIINE